MISLYTKINTFLIHAFPHVRNTIKNNVECVFDVKQYRGSFLLAIYSAMWKCPRVVSSTRMVTKTSTFLIIVCASIAFWVDTRTFWRDWWINNKLGTLPYLSCNRKEPILRKLHYLFGFLLIFIIIYYLYIIIVIMKINYELFLIKLPW